MRCRRSIFLVLAALAIVAWCADPARADAATGPVKARLEVPHGEFTVGDPIELKLIVEHPPGAVFDLPDVAAALGRAPATPAGQEAAQASGAEGVSSLMVEDVKPFEATQPVSGRTVWSIRMRVFSPGQRTLPSITLGYRLEGGPEKAEVSTEPVTITVASVLKSKQEDASDIKGQWLLPREWLPWLIVVAVALALAALAFYLWRRFRRRPGAAPAVPTAPVVPPEHAYDRALRELADLLAGGLLAEGRIKEFHVALSEIVKRFLGTLHGFDALDRTTRELMADLRARQLPEGLSEETYRFLCAADLVKFAKHRPETIEIDNTVLRARRIIETGRPAPVQTGSEVAA